MEAGWYVGVFAFALLDWSAIILNRLRWRWVAKPAVMVVLVAGYTQAGGWQTASAWFGAGLLFSLLGDVLLLVPRAFPGGLAAFLGAHLCYTLAFSLPPAPLIPAALAIALALCLIIRLAYHRLSAYSGIIRAGARLRYAVLAYILVISAMVFSALTSLWNPAWNLPAALLASGGALAFFFSDWILATQRFVHPSRRGRVTVMVAYHLAQTALTSAFLLRAV
ncbi:MAG: lysoplasmalogenase [Chloroflexota bacterium]